MLNLRIECQHHTIFLKCSHHVHCTYCLWRHIFLIKQEVIVDFLREACLNLPNRKLLFCNKKKLQKSWRMDSFEQSNRKVKIRFVSFPIIYIPIHVVELLNWCSIALISFVFLVNCVCQFVTSPCQRWVTSSNKSNPSDEKLNKHK